MENINNSLKNYSKYWYLQVIIGIIFIIFGGMLMSNPASTFITVTIFFVTTFIFVGALEIVFAIVNRNQMIGWGWPLLNGVLSLILGIYLALNLNVALEVLPLVISFAILFRSIFAMILSFKLKSIKTGSWLGLLLLSILGIVFSVLALSKPAIIEVYVVFLIAFSFFSIGINSIFYGFSLKNIKNHLENNG